MFETKPNISFFHSLSDGGMIGSGNTPTPPKVADPRLMSAIWKFSIDIFHSIISGGKFSNLIVNSRTSRGPSHSPSSNPSIDAVNGTSVRFDFSATDDAVFPTTAAAMSVKSSAIRFLRAVVGKVVWGDTSIIARVKMTVALAACASLIGCQPAYAGIIGAVSDIVQAGAAVSAASSMSDIAEAQKAAAENAARPAPTNPLFEKENPLADAYCVNCHKPIFQIRDIDKYGFGHGDGVYCFGKLYFVKHRKNGRIKTIFCEKGEGGSYEKCYSGTSDAFRNPHKALEE